MTRFFRGANIFKMFVVFSHRISLAVEKYYLLLLANFLIRYQLLNLYVEANNSALYLDLIVKVRF